MYLGTIIRAVNTVSTAREFYFDCVGAEALKRAGGNQNLKGVVHELLFRDKRTLTTGGNFRLTKNPHAHGVDVVRIKGGKARERYQVKDCVSQGGVAKTLKQVRSGKYKNVTLVGTKETAKRYNAARKPGDKPMVSSGISSKRTGRIADNASPKQKGASARNNFADILECSVDSALTAAGLGAVSAILNKGDPVDALAAAVKGGTKTGARTAAALTGKEAGKAVGRASGYAGLTRLVGGAGGTAFCFGMTDVAAEALGLYGREEPTKSRVRKAVGGATGGYVGMLAGVKIGTVICPGVGTLIFGISGSLAGDFVGRGVGAPLIECACEVVGATGVAVSEIGGILRDGICSWFE